MADFASVIDSGLYHGFSDKGRRCYVRGLAHVVEPGGRLFLKACTRSPPGSGGQRRREPPSPLPGDPDRPRTTHRHRALRDGEPAPESARTAESPAVMWR